jgi:hypothetical protein
MADARQLKAVLISVKHGKQCMAIFIGYEQREEAKPKGSL